MRTGRIGLVYRHSILKYSYFDVGKNLNVQVFLLFLKGSSSYCGGSCKAETCLHKYIKKNGFFISSYQAKAHQARDKEGSKMGLWE